MSFFGYVKEIQLPGYVFDFVESVRKGSFLLGHSTECVGVFLQYSIMGDKKIKQSKAKNNRRWTDLELDCFADVLADPENCRRITRFMNVYRKSSSRRCKR